MSFVARAVTLRPHTELLFEVSRATGMVVVSTVMADVGAARVEFPGFHTGSTPHREPSSRSSSGTSDQGRHKVPLEC